MQYFKVIFHNPTTHEVNNELYVSASSMYRVALWVLKNRPMNDYYAMNIIEVNPDKSRKQRGDFMANAIREYFHSDEAYGNKSDEYIRAKEIARCVKRLQEVR